MKKLKKLVSGDLFFIPTEKRIIRDNQNETKRYFFRRPLPIAFMISLIIFTSCEKTIVSEMSKEEDVLLQQSGATNENQFIYESNNFELISSINPDFNINLTTADLLLNKLDFNKVVNIDQAYAEWGNWLVNNDMWINFNVSSSEIKDMMRNTPSENYAIMQSGTGYSEYHKEAIMQFRSDIENGLGFTKAFDSLKNGLFKVGSEATPEQVMRANLFIESIELLFKSNSINSPIAGVYSTRALIDPCTDAVIALTVSWIGLVTTSCVGLGFVGLVGVVFSSAAVDENC